jgi:hypothetical protein
MGALAIEQQIKAEEALSEHLDAFAGQWVAVRAHEVVAHADTLNALLEEIRGEEVEGVFQVPHERAAACFF